MISKIDVLAHQIIKITQLIINLIVPFFIYDLASLLVGAITAANYDPWLAFWPMTLLLWLPFVSDAVCVVVAAVRFRTSSKY